MKYVPTYEQFINERDDSVTIFWKYMILIPKNNTHRRNMSKDEIEGYIENVMKRHKIHSWTRDTDAGSGGTEYIPTTYRYTANIPKNKEQIIKRDLDNLERVNVIDSFME
jgi:hypothetical protein